MNENLGNLTETLLAAAQANGADAADAIAIDGTSLSIDVLGGKLEHAERSEGTEIGIRVMVGNRQACVSASDTSKSTIATMAERAVAMAQEAPEDDTIVQAEPGEFADTWDLCALELSDPSDDPAPAQLEDMARDAEAAALAVSGVTKVQASSSGFGRHAIHLATSQGFSGGYERSDYWTSCVAITGEGTRMERDYSGEARVFLGDLPSPASIGMLAGERTAARAGSRKPPTGSFPVLFDERISSSLVGHLLSAVNGQAVARGASWARDLLCKQVLPAHLSLQELPHRARVGGSRPFDAEGLAKHDRKIVDNGVLTGWTLDLSTARKLGMTSTANAARGTSSPPSPSITNVTLTPGEHSRQDLIRDMGTGLLVTSMIGSSINPTTGDYSRGASGFWVENGEIAYPVNECTIAGNLIQMLQTIVPANDARTYLSHVVPSLLVEGLTIAGE